MISTISGGTVRLGDAGDGTEEDPPRRVVTVWWGARAMERHVLPRAATIWVRDGDDVPPKTVLATAPFGAWRGHDASSLSLSCLHAVLCARLPRRQRPALVAARDGVVEAVDDGRVRVRYADGRGRTLRTRALVLVRAGDAFAAGDALSSGWRSHHRLLRAWGPERLRAHMLEELDAFTRDDLDAPPRVWWSVVVRAMTDWVRVRRAGDSALGRNAITSRTEFDAAARAVTARGGAPPEGVAVLRGIDAIARERLRPRGGPRPRASRGSGP